MYFFYTKLDRNLASDTLAQRATDLLDSWIDSYVDDPGEELDSVVEEELLVMAAVMSGLDRDHFVKEAAKYYEDQRIKEVDQAKEKAE